MFYTLHFDYFILVEINTSALFVNTFAFLFHFSCLMNGTSVLTKGKTNTIFGYLFGKYDGTLTTRVVLFDAPGFNKCLGHMA